MNLLTETEQALKNHNLSLKNIKYILNSEGYIPVADFVAAAHNINYNNGWGAVEIDPSLKIVGASWWLERANYDGLEGWIFCKKPSEPKYPAVDFNLKTERDNRYSLDHRLEK